MDEDGLVVLDGAVELARALLHGNLHEEAGEEGAANVGVVILVLKGRRDEFEAVRLHDALELRADVVGAGEVAKGQEVLVAPLLYRVGVRRRLALEGVIGVEERKVVAVGVAEVRLHLVGALAVVGGADKDLGHREERGDGEDLVGAVELGRRDEHDGEGRVQRELGRHAAQRGELAVVV